MSTSGEADNKPLPGEEEEYNKRQEISQLSSDKEEQEEENEEIISISGSGNQSDDPGEDNESKEDSQEDDEAEEGSEVDDQENDGSIIEPPPKLDFNLECSCKNPKNVLSALSLMKELVENDSDINTVDCDIDNIIRSLNIIISNCKDIVSVERVACIDLFYRYRHELLFRLLTWAFNLPRGKSDMPFSDFGIESERTPDLIYEYKGVIYIVEVTAVGSKERGAQSKGVEELGFEGKYKKEALLLEENGYSVCYLPIIFNMNDTNMPYSLEQMKSLESVFPRSKSMYMLLLSKARHLSMISQDIKQFFLFSSTLLFSKFVYMPENHLNHNFLYERSPRSNIKYGYKECVVSPFVYNKIDQVWGRLETMIINKDFTDDDKVQISLNLMNNRISFEKNIKGISCGELLKAIKENDKLTIFQNLYLTTNYGVYSAVENEQGVKIYVKKNLGKTSNSGLKTNEDSTARGSEDLVPTFCSHSTFDYDNQLFPINYYTKFVNSEESLFYNYIDFDNDYEDKLINLIKKSDIEDFNNDYERFKEISLLGTRLTGNINMDSLMESVKREFIRLNTADDALPIKKLKMKSPFIYPLARVTSLSYCSISYKNIDFIKNCMEALPLNGYTSKIMQSVLNPDFQLFEKSKQPSKEYQKLVNERINYSNQINLLQKEVYKKGSSDGVLRISKTKDDKFRSSFLSLRDKLNSINKSISDRVKMEKLPLKRGFIRLPTKGKSELSRSFEQEMEHFKKKNVQSTVEGVGIRTTLEQDYEKDYMIFSEINNRLVTYSGQNIDLLLDDKVYNDAKLLKDLKQIALDEYRNLVEQVKNSQLGHSAAFISRLCHSLMYLSQQPFNSDYIKVDNLGYDDVVLIVKGGKKIFKSKSSKLFRIIYPVLAESLPWFCEGHQDKGSNLFFKFKGSVFVITPWMMFHESILTDGISFYPRVASFTILNSNPKLKLEEQYNKLSTNVMLAFHNRRQTEVLLANLRYILLSTLGDFTGFEEIITEFFGFNYDSFQSFIRASILFNYPKYFQTFKLLKESKVKVDINMSDFKYSRLKNIFTNDVIYQVEDLAIMIYSTFLMTKAPYQRAVERSNNLRGILKIHELYDNSIGLNKSPREQLDLISTCIQPDDDLYSYTKKLFSNDFNIDPNFCSAVGVFIDSELNNKGLKDEIHNEWYSILGSAWDEMATSTGLRGHYDSVEDFWGQKGYFVVYKDLLQDMDFMSNLNRLFFELNNSDSEKRKILRKLNLMYGSKVDLEREFLIFHAVDKVQWKGGREIYVMDIDTKILQQPIEKFMGYLCKKMDNELISIPSDKRSQVIHHSIFEKDLPLKDMLTWYLTLDCTKWAPKSVFVKFIITFLTMSVIPNSFKRHFMNYSEKLFYKRIYFNDAEVVVLLNNPTYKELIDKYLKKDSKVGGYYILAPYSWVMGIFNYTSSFLHAANQKYMSYLLMNTSMSSFQEETYLFMFAHSDDSGGRLTVSNRQMATRALILYEIGLKGCNHLLSRKKSVISRIYFEILSIIYLFKQLLALLPKFLGGLRFLPTDKGACQDMSQSYSKCIEVMVAGANFSIAYIVLKIYSAMIWRFYQNQDPVENDYKRPVQYLGMPDAHPLMALLCGSDSDIIRLYHTDIGHLQKTMAFSRELIECNEESGPIKPYKFEIRVKSIKKDFEEMIKDYSNVLDSWSVRNINYHNSGFNFLNFLNKLRDAGFVGSLVNESTTRRFSRAFFMKNNEVILTKFGNMKIRDITDALRLFQGYSSETSAVKHIFNDILDENSINFIDKSINEGTEKIKVLMGVIKETLQSPIKLYTYLEKLSMKGRKIEQHHRTLKPTVVQLVKSTPVFSSRFDPTSLVSFIKEPEMRWALPDVRGLFTAEIELKNLLSRRGLELDQIDADSLLKICRDFGPGSIKTIYLYSRIPSELRQVKSYSAFLTFLSVNSFDNSEISGLTVKLTSSEITSEFTNNNINEDIYYLVNILSSLCVLYQKIDLSFFEKLTLNEIPEFDFPGGSISSLITHIWDSLGSDINITYYKPYLDYLSIILNDTSRHAGQLTAGSFYTFIKSQRLRSGWYGKGEIYINIEGSFYSFELYNQTIMSVITNHTGKVLQHHSDYIFDVMQHNGLEIHKMGKIKKSDREGMASFFGFDYSGHLSCGPSRELITGVSCFIKSNRGAFIDELNTFTISNLSNNILTIRSDIYEKPLIKKIYLLPLKKGEIVNTYIRILRKEDFDSKLNSEGLGTFEEFIYTELLTEYGGENYISLNNLLDNFSASKLFQIFTECRKKEISLIPKSTSFSNFPANLGSLTRILIDYGEYTGKPIIKTNLEYNAAMMQVISEYPEKMSVVLSEKLVNYYDKMYTKEELKEISDEYHNLSESEDPDLIRNSIIKLMTHWGYGSFVNSIQNFSLKRISRNYNFFNLLGLLPDRVGSFSNLFVYTINCLITEMMSWSEQYRGLEFDNPRLRNVTGMNGVCMNFIRYICVSLFEYKILDKIPNIIVIQFYATVMNLMKEEDFCAGLQLSMSKNYLLGSVPISYNYRNEFIIMLNTFRHIWSVNNRIEFNPSRILKNERLPHHIPNWKSIAKQFKFSIPPILSMYNGFINTQTVQELIKRCNGIIKTRFGRYHLRGELKNVSQIEIPTIPEWKPSRPIKQSILESDLWEDFCSEFEFEDVDIDTVDELLKEMGNIYVQKSTIIRGFGADKNIFANLSIVIDTLSECQTSKIKRLRQVGQNIIWVRTVESSEILSSLYNCKLRVVQFTKGEIIYIYTSFQNEINNDELLNYMFGEVSHYISIEDADQYNVSIVRDRDGKEKSCLDLGFVFEDKLMSGDAVFVNDGEILTTESKNELEERNQENNGEDEAKPEDPRMEIIKKIRQLEDEGIGRDACGKLLNKYLGLINDYSLSLRIAMTSLLEESELIKMSKSLSEQTSLLTPAEYKKTFMAPTHFGAAYGLGNYGDKNIKDKNIKAEIEAFHEELSSRVGSGAIFISSKFKKLAIANLKFWNSSVKSTNYKKENKAFAVLVYTSLLNCCKVIEDDRDDLIWQDCINRMTLYISDEKDDSDDDEDLMSLIEDIKSHSRLIYRPKGT